MKDQREKHEVAAGYLRRSGVKVLDHDWYDRIENGSADFVAEENGSLVIVVLFDHIPRDLAEATRRRYRRMALHWMEAHGRRYDRVRVDVVRVTLLPMGQNNIEHAPSLG